MMTKSRLLLLPLLVAVGLATGEATGQVFTPSYQAPRTGADLGIYLSGDRGDFAFEGILRRNMQGYDLGLRAGVADYGDAAVLLGADLRNRFMVEDVPLELAFTAGVQVIISDHAGAGFIVGVSAGQTFVPGDFSITPYVHPRIGLVSRARPGADLQPRVLADIGADFAFQPNLTFRIGLGLGSDTADWGVGLAWR